MQNLVVMTVAGAGLLFSVAVALLVEELLFGALFRVFFLTVRRAGGSQKP
jgi:hypothetical protein